MQGGACVAVVTSAWVSYMPMSQIQMATKLKFGSNDNKGARLFQLRLSEKF